MKKEKHFDFNKIENINVDIVIGLGPTCRAAAALKRNNLRIFSSPLDWMLNYSLSDVITLLKEKGKNFFSDCSEAKEYSSEHNTGIIDNRNGMISMHDYPKDRPIDKAGKYFSKKYKYKFKKLDKLLKRAKSICIVTNREIFIDEFQNFIKEFVQLYKFKQIYFINIFDTQTQQKSLEIYYDNNVTYYICNFDDAHEFGREKAQNPYFWLGNVREWDNILKKISVNKDFSDRYKSEKVIFNTEYDFSLNETYYVITIFGKQFKFKVNV